MERSQGPFEFLEVLGEGSFGTVLVARVIADPLGRRVALKILKGVYTRNRKIMNRTRDEARILSKLSHPNIVRVEKLMELNGRPVVVMEHVEGVSLDTLLTRYRNGLPGAVALGIARRMCTALHVAYAEAVGGDGRALNVIHRDIKPSNVLLSVHGEVKVVDFGIAKGDFEGREAETESVVMGSRPYMAPERLDGVADSPLVDVYSTGMSLYELLTGNTMTLSINPVQHERAMNRQLDFVQVKGMSDATLDDLRGLIRRMCAYTREYRPTAVQCSRDLGLLIQQIADEEQRSLEDFASQVVRPLYDARERILPEAASEAADIQEVTNTLGRASTPPTRVRRMHAAPLVFIGGLISVIVALGALAYVRGPGGGASGVVEVRVWIPNHTTVEVGGYYLKRPTRVPVLPGPADLVVEHDDGRRYRCAFDAADGVTVRYVGASLSVNDGADEPCEAL